MRVKESGLMTPQNQNIAKLKKRIKMKTIMICIGGEKIYEFYEGPVQF